jgi:hypothetical protein
MVNFIKTNRFVSAQPSRMIRSELKLAGAVETMLAFVRSEKKMNIFYIIGVVVVIIVVAGFFGLHI